MITAQQASQGFSAVGSPARLEVLRALVRAGPSGLCIGEIQNRLQIPASTLAHHLRSLVQAQLITQQKSGREVTSRAEFGRIQDLAAYLLEQCCDEDPSYVASTASRSDVCSI